MYQTARQIVLEQMYNMCDWLKVKVVDNFGNSVKISDPKLLQLWVSVEKDHEKVYNVLFKPFVNVEDGNTKRWSIESEAMRRCGYRYRDSDDKRLFAPFEDRSLTGGGVAKVVSRALSDIRKMSYYRYSKYGLEKVSAMKPRDISNNKDLVGRKKKDRTGYMFCKDMVVRKGENQDLGVENNSLRNNVQLGMSELENLEMNLGGSQCEGIMTTNQNDCKDNSKVAYGKNDNAVNDAVDDALQLFENSNDFLDFDDETENQDQAPSREESLEILKSLGSSRRVVGGQQPVEQNTNAKIELNKRKRNISRDTGIRKKGRTKSTTKRQTNVVCNILIVDINKDWFALTLPFSCTLQSAVLEAFIPSQIEKQRRKGTK